ncbi:hypothetical protein Rhopal_006963-T1 [Rhodotorula paludigena]|uniref:Major facilitator superfamily (MFS) profile domain-containing protein n=1 Tax=Rhodotorula paludigena TaxID=86838 RepID=A0AAV5GXL6_9BASI|nr:hypothetical protein Rhopal_006963-T1 [Rhodotorula paludigena]
MTHKPIDDAAGSTAVDAMSLTTDKVRREAEKREFSHSSPPPTDDHGRIAKKGAFQGTTMPEGTRLNASGVPTYMGATGNKLGILITIAASCGFILFGYDQGVMSGLISSPQFVRTFPLADAAVQGEYRVGAVFALLFGDKLGRRRMIFWGSVILCFGVVIQVTTFRGHWQSGQFIIGRIVTGLGTGFQTSTIPTWHAECAKAHSRGLSVFIEAAMISTGTMVSYWVDLGFSFLDSSVSWRVPIALQCIFAIGVVVMLLFLPESPRWLVSKGKMVEAQRVVAALEPAPFDSEVVILQVKVIADSLEGQTHQRKRDLLTNGPTQHLRRMIIGASTQFFQQIGGCNAVIYFSTVIFEEYLGVDRTMALILGSVLATVYALAACISFPLVDRVGRRKLFYIGTLGQSLSMFLIMACIIPGRDSSAINGSIVGLFLFLTFFGFTWLELPWLYPAEINPLKTRTNANAVSTISNWLWNFTVVMFTPPFLASTAVGCFGAVNLFYLETAGRSLEEIDLIFAKGYVEGVSYVKMAKIMPKYSTAEIEAEWQRLGLSDEDRPQSAMGSTAGDV